MTRRLLREGYRASFTAVLDMSASMQALVQNTSDHEKAVAAVLAKRSAEFDGT